MTDARIVQAGELRSVRVESLRAVAALSVFAGHTLYVALTGANNIYLGTKNQLITGGGLGVYLFFALSGYLLFWPFLRAQFGDAERIDLRRYAVNRALRILPLYYTVVIVLFALAPNGAKLGDWWRWAFFVENYSLDSAARLLHPLWTLVIEIQFYAALPLLAWLIARVGGRSLRRTALAVGALGLASFVLRAVGTTYPAHTPNPVGFFGSESALPTFLYFFAAGMLLAVLRMAWERERPARLDGWLGSSTLWMAAGAVLWFQVTRDLISKDALIAPASFLFVGAAILPLRPGWPVRVLEWKPLATIGLASYSLYLWHGPILQALANQHTAFPPHRIVEVGHMHDFKTLLFGSLPLVLAAALLSYRLIEVPFLRLRKRWASSSPRMVDEPGAGDAATAPA